MPYRAPFLSLATSLMIVLSAQAEIPTQPTIVVTASRQAEKAEDSPAAITIITREDIERGQSQDLVELFRDVPGIDIVRTGGFGQNTAIFMRGTNSNHVLVLIDGIRVASTNTGAFAFEHVPLETIERIEIVRGPRAAYYGSDAIGGVIHIFTRAPRNLEFQAKAGTWNYYSGTAAGGFAQGNSSFSALANGQTFAGFSAQKPTGYSYHPDRDGYQNRTIDLKGKTRIGNHDLNAAAQGTNADIDFDQGRSHIRSHHVGLHLAGPISSRWSHEATLGGNYENLNTPDFFNRFVSKRTDLDWLHHYQLGQNQNITAGLNASREQGKLVDTFSGLETYATTRDNQALFLSWHGAQGKLDWEFAARHDRNDSFGNHNSVLGNASWRFDDKLRAGLSYTEGFRAPNLNELYSPGFDGLFAGNPALNPEKAQSVELNAQYREPGRHALEISLFSTRIDELVAFQGERFRAINIARAEIEGVEAEYRKFFERTTLHGTLTWQEAEDGDTGLPLLRRPRTKFALGADRRFAGKWEAGAQAQYASARRDFDADLESYVIVQLHCGRRIGRDWRFGARLDNALDSDYELASSFATPGRSVLLSVEYAPHAL